MHHQNHLHQNPQDEGGHPFWPSALWMLHDRPPDVHASVVLHHTGHSLQWSRLHQNPFGHHCMYLCPRSGTAGSKVVQRALSATEVVAKPYVDSKHLAVDGTVHTEAHQQLALQEYEGTVLATPHLHHLRHSLQTVVQTPSLQFCSHCHGVCDPLWMKMQCQRSQLVRLGFPPLPAQSMTSLAQTPRGGAWRWVLVQ